MIFGSESRFSPRLEEVVFTIRLNVLFQKHSNVHVLLALINAAHLVLNPWSPNAPRRSLMDGLDWI